jgi:hypothetical protein
MEVDVILKEPDITSEFTKIKKTSQKKYKE